jgi:Glycosyl transferase family 2
VRVALTLLVRDEIDVVEAHLAFHLAAGVDVVIASDHRSTDGTTEVLERYAAKGLVHLIRREEEQIRQSAWMTEMARLAATEHGADWVINSDADEFWWPAAASFKDALAAVPRPFGIVYAISRVFVPRPGDGRFAERMTARLALPAPINDPATPFRHVAKVAHRADANAVVMQGNHRVTGVPYRDVRGWSPLEVLHFPLRSATQAAAKHEHTWTAWRRNLRGDIARARRRFDEGRASDFYDRVALDDATIARGIADGSLIDDTRLRDALRALSRGEQLPLGRGSFADEASRGLDSAVLAEADTVRLQRRADALAERIGRRTAVYRPAYL